jgi:peptidoglycan hydrolase-like protein with peptidoglycan-binding domain
MRHLAVMFTMGWVLGWALITGAQVPGPPQQSGDREQLRRVQERLKAVGFDPGPLDGTLSARTVDALRAFQQQHGLPVTGKPDQATRDALLRQAGGEGPADARERPGGSPVDPTVPPPRPALPEQPPAGR